MTTNPAPPRPVMLAWAVLLCAAAVLAGPAQLQLQVSLGNPSRLAELSKLVAVENVQENTAMVTVLPSQLSTLQAHGFGFEVLPAPKTAAVTMCEPGWEDSAEPAWDCYPDYTQYVALMQRLAAEHPLICRLEDLGPTTNTAAPHRLLALQITEEPEVQREVPEVLLTSTMHGDETTGFVLLLRLAWVLLESYGVDPEVTELVRDSEIWVNPLANPDGTYFGGDHTVTQAIRFFTTSDGRPTSVNPNRNFPDPEDGPHPDGNPWWRETEVMMAFAGRHSFTLSANLHGGAELVNYPWDTWCSRHPDDDWFVDISTQWATSAQNDGPAGYMDDCANPRCAPGVCRPGVTHGADWYAISGGRQDYMTFFRGGRELTVEISATKLLPSDRLEDLWIGNREAFFGFLRQARRGVHGVVRDPAGHPLPARVELIGHDSAATRSWVQSDPDVGDFHRLTVPGTYDLLFSASGYVDEVVSGVVVPDAPPYPHLEIELIPDPTTPSPTAVVAR